MQLTFIQTDVKNITITYVILDKRTTHNSPTIVRFVEAIQKSFVKHERVRCSDEKLRDNLVWRVSLVALSFD